jgi:hypothetical protein
MKKSSIIILVLIIATVAYFYWPENEIKYPPGILIQDEPVQTDLQKVEIWQKDDYTITPLAKFTIRARVLSKENYWLGREADLSPTDLALGWGEMSDQNVLDKMEISQSDRWFEWRAKVLPIPVNVITSHASNMHIIPGNDNVKSILDEIEKGSLISMTGYLIRIDAKDGWHWVSSLSRTDTQGGACEVVWADSIAILNTSLSLDN